MLFPLGASAPGAAAAASGNSTVIEQAMTVVGWLSSAEHFEQLINGLVTTRGLAYFAFMIGAFLVATKTAIESVRWR
jgi:hypothetical protein